MREVTAQLGDGLKGGRQKGNVEADIIATHLLFPFVEEINIVRPGMKAGKFTTGERERRGPVKPDWIFQWPGKLYNIQRCKKAGCGTVRTITTGIIWCHGSHPRGKRPKQCRLHMKARMFKHATSGVEYENR